MYQDLLTEIDAGVGIITLNRADRDNAFDERTLLELIAATDAMERDASVRVVVFSSTGKTFCAGADLAWMRRAAAQGVDENLRDARELAEALRRIAQLSKPTVARVQGSAFGGGVGIVAACDIAVAVLDARFAVADVKLGLIPSAVAPYMVAAIGLRHARRYMMTGEHFSAAEGYRIGLFNEMVADAGALDEAVGQIVDNLLDNGPRALAACKALAEAAAGGALTPGLIEDAAQRGARVGSSDEAREGTLAFLEQRMPLWRRTDQAGGE